MNTKKEKQNRPAVRRPVLKEAQDILSKEIDIWSKLSDLDDPPVKVRPAVRAEPLDKLSWLNEAKKRLHKQWE